MVDAAIHNDQQLAAVSMWDEKADRPHFVRDLYEMCGYVVAEPAESGLRIVEDWDGPDEDETEVDQTDLISLADWVAHANALAEQHGG